MRILICGGRDYGDREAVSRAFVSFILSEDTIITGGASGADTLAHEEALNRGNETEVYPAQWDKYGRSAGPRRNKQMLETGIDTVIAFPGGRGTAHMKKIAREANVPVIEVS